MSFSVVLLEYAVRLIDSIGYLGVALILMVDNAGLPIPSEATLALSGAAARAGHFNLGVILLIGVLAQSAGSSLAYFIGHSGGAPLIKKYGKYLLISVEDYEKTQKWFKKNGPRAIFVSRITPVVRTFMGFVAGAAGMSFGSFLWQSLLGSAVWTVIWVAIGYAVGEGWRQYYEYMHYMDYLVLGVLCLYLGRFIWRRARRQAVGNKGNKK